MLEPASPRRLILTLYGLYARQEGNWLSVRALVALMSALGVESAAVRSSVSRMKRRDVLRPEHRDGQAGYALAPETIQLLRAGDERIWSRPRGAVTDGWLMVVFSVPEAQRSRRHALRSLLNHLGFGSVSAGVSIAPAAVRRESTAALQRAGLAEYTELFHSTYLDEATLRDRVGQWWDLDALRAEYAGFLDRHGPAHRRITGAQVAPSEAFGLYVPMLTDWRALPYRDPGIPLECLPPDWPGVRAAATFGELDAALRDAAAQYAHGMVQ